MKKINNIFYILPCFNEELNLKKLLNDFFLFYKKKKFKIIILIVDDGSTDNSLKVIKKINSNNKNKNIKIKILINKKNLGLGLSLKNGFEYCLSKGKKGDVLISMDCDNSHTVPLSFKMINLILNKNKDIVIASRYRKNSKTNGLDQLRILLSYCAAILYKIFFPIDNVRDYTCGFRAFKFEKLKQVHGRYNNFFSEKGFSASADILLKSYRYKNILKFWEIPINLRYDLKQGQSKMKIFKTIYLNLALIIKRKLFS